MHVLQFKEHNEIPVLRILGVKVELLKDCVNFFFFSILTIFILLQIIRRKVSASVITFGLRNCYASL